MRDPFLVFLPMLGWLFFSSLVAYAASKFHRAPATWLMLALLLSPLAAFFLLLVAGDPEATRALQEKEERIRERHPDRKDLREAALNEMECPHCGAPVNPVTGDGLHSLPAEPWLLICNECQGRVEPG